MPRTLAPADLERHEPFGLALRHRLIAIDGTVIPAWTDVVNLGQPDGVTVSRHSRNPIPTVVCRPSGLGSIPAGTVLECHARDLLVALGEIGGSCSCTDGDHGCINRR